MRTRHLTLVLLLGSTGYHSIRADKAPTAYFEQDIAESNPLRVAQAEELNTYIRHVAAEKAPLRAVFQPNYSSTSAYLRSTEPYRAAFASAIGYPPFGDVPGDMARFDVMGEDALGVYYRVYIPVLPQVQAEGIYIVPKAVSGRAPLIISQHGGAGSPELALFKGGANYHDMVRGAVKRGYAVFAPQLLFSSPGLSKENRRETDRRLRLVGTSLTAVEVAKITRSLDVLLKRPEIDPTRVGMVGLSYGGYYTLVVTALEPRIRVAVSSGYFGVQEGRYAANELSLPSDLEFPGRMTLFRDPDFVALICPRPLQLQAGDRDEIHHATTGRQLSIQAAQYYQHLGKDSRFEHHIFSGGHEFNDDLAWRFMERHLSK